MAKTFSEYKAATTKDRSADIRAFLKTLGDRYVNEYELCRATRVSTCDVAKYRDAFKAHVVQGTRARGAKCFYWAGTAKLAKQMRGVSK